MSIEFFDGKIGPNEEAKLKNEGRTVFPYKTGKEDGYAIGNDEDFDFVSKFVEGLNRANNYAKRKEKEFNSLPEEEKANYIHKPKEIEP